MTDARADATAMPQAGAGWGWIIGYGVLSVILGLAAFAWPFSATFAATLIIGIFFLAAGVVSIASGVFGHGHAGRGYAIGFGIVSLVVGMIMTFEPVSGALSLTLLVAIWLGLRGALELVWGVRMQRHRVLMVALGVVNIVLALIVLATLPWSALTLPGYILGISFLMGGITAITTGAAHKQGTAAFAV